MSIEYTGWIYLILFKFYLMIILSWHDSNFFHILDIVFVMFFIVSLQQYCNPEYIPQVLLQRYIGEKFSVRFLKQYQCICNYVIPIITLTIIKIITDSKYNCVPFADTEIAALLLVLFKQIFSSLFWRWENWV